MTTTLPVEPVIVLDADKTAVATKHAKEVSFAAATIAQSLKGPTPLSLDLASSCISVAEFQLRDLGKVLGIETENALEVEQRYARLKAANARIRELEAQLGDAHAPELTQMGIKRLSEHINAWWDLEGFGHISDMHFGQYGVDVKFSCSLFGTFRLIDSPTPVSDQDRKAAWYSSLTERGFVLGVEEGEREPSLVDCDVTRQALCELFTNRMPSADVTSFDNHVRKRQFTLRGVQVFIRRYEDILALPIPPKEGV